MVSYSVLMGEVVLRQVLHYSGHFLFPGLVAWLFFRKEWKKAWLIFLLTMLVDLDHLLASPIFESGRCSINFHPLHTYWAMVIYGAGMFFRGTRMISVGLLLHMIFDGIDCILMGL